MGIGSDLIVDLTQLKKAGLLSDRLSVVEIGAQQLSNTFLEATEALEGLFSLFGVTPAYVGAIPDQTHIVHGNLEHLSAEAPFARDFWTALGFDYAAVDIDGSPGSIPLDLNFDAAPREARGQYDIVTNFGTTEHVCNQLNAFKVIHDLTRPEGIMIHALPSQGMLNHGLVNYNPKFFWMLARSNNYGIELLDFIPSGAPYALSDNFRKSIGQFGNVPAERHANYRTEDVLLKVILKKTFDAEFVSPLDVPTGSEPANAVMQDRYWTVYSPKLSAVGRVKRLVRRLLA